MKEVAAHSACWAKAGPPPQDGPRAQSTLQRWHQVHDLLGKGVGLLECARRLNLSLNTVKRARARTAATRPAVPATLVDPYRDDLAGLVRAFADLLRPREGNADRLDTWITTARAADLPHLHAFTRGLDQDRDAVRAAVTLPHHNGGTEGVNTKTKRITRQMHGRASFALLRHRILLG